ncbi:MAG: hypothetical protein JNL98_31840 [Bryobacterales bacterium]|nr:hypothetical protein [Bryobacterales bacterium]
MSGVPSIDVSPIREAMAGFEISARVEPNESIGLDRVFFPDAHRGVLDVRRQLVVGNRGTGKSFWTHALTNPEVRNRVADAYTFPALAQTNVIIGFNGSTKLSGIAPTIEEIQAARKAEVDPELVWRAVILRAVRSVNSREGVPCFADALGQLRARPVDYAVELTAADDAASKEGRSTLIVFDALDRLAHEWGQIREITKGLLLTVLGLQSFRSIRAKVFMRVDQVSDVDLFRFPDSSKIRNDRVDLTWQSHELYGLLFFELLRQQGAASPLRELARGLGVGAALPSGGRLNAVPSEQSVLVSAIAGDYMGKSPKRGRVYTWVPLHLGDAANTCSPRTFLTAWKSAAEHRPALQAQVVDHLGLSEGVRMASSARLTELREDYPWIDLALAPLSGKLVPIAKADLFDLWKEARVTERITQQAERSRWLLPIGVAIENSPEALLRTMASIAVMEERANGKINVPDIFRVEAKILRKGGVAVPRRN